MGHDDSRKKKLDLLKQTLANKDFAQARRLLDDAGKTCGDGASRGAGDPPARAFHRPERGGQAAPPSSSGQSYGTHNADETPASREAPSPRGLPASSLPGDEATEIVNGMPASCWLIRLPLAEAAPRRLAAAREFAAVLRGARQRVDELNASPALCHAQNARPEDLLFATIAATDDTETADAKASIFLISVMRFEGEQLLFEHDLAHRRDEESAVLHAFARRLEETGVLVAFDVKALHLKHLRERADALGVDLGDRLPPCVLIHDESRRRWKNKLATFGLKTLEKQICRHIRAADTPRPDLADAYRHFLAEADAAPLTAALHHTRLDLLAQAEILTAILTQCDPPELDNRPRKRKE